MFFILAVLVLGVAIMLGYVKGMRGGHAWGKKVILLALPFLVAVVLFRPLAFPILALFLGGGAVVAYLKGVKKGVPWAKKVVVGCSAAVVVLVLCRVLAGPDVSASTAERESDKAVLRAKVIGQALRPHLRQGSKVLVLGEIPEDSTVMLPETMEAWKEGLAKGSGDSSLTVVGYAYADVGAGEKPDGGLSAALEQVKGPVDAIISFAGLPENLEQSDLYKKGAARPKIAVFRLEPSEQESARMRRWLRDGLVEAVAVERDGKVWLCKPSK